MGSQAYWVLKDPMSRALQYVQEDEYAILQLVDGRRSPQEIVDACIHTFPTKFISPESLLHFLADAKRRHLIVGATKGNLQASHPSSRVGLTSRQTWWRNPLAIRFPGIRPDRILGLLFPLAKPLFTKSAWFVYLTLLMISSLILVANWDAISIHIASAFANRGAHTLVQFMVVISLVKIIHELAHAAACNVLGGDCRELGVMLLLGVPCLYCDVSDAWMMPQRFKRILVSAAGMIAELGIAAIATLLWFWTGDAELREWWLVVMVVCSVSTVIVNGNPLMRYDGYFILSDLVGIPNLASKASTTLRSIVRQLLWGEFGSDEPSHKRQRFGLATYAVLSGCYRTMVLSLFVFAVYQFTSSHAFVTVGVLFAAVMAKSVLAPTAKSILTPPRLFFRSQQGSRRSLISVSIVLAAVLLLWVPLPRSVVAPMTIGPLDSQEVFLNVGGRLLASLPEASRLRTGDTIASFNNSVLTNELLDAEMRFEQLATEEKSLIGSRSARADVTAQLLATEAAKQSMRDRVELLRAEVRKLTLTAQKDGTLFFPAEQFNALSDTSDYESWSQSPLHEDNIGAWIEPGTMVGIVGDPERREAILMVDQKSASLIKIGQAVDLRRPSVQGDECFGEVVEVGSTPVVDFPAELLATGLIPLDSYRVESRKRVPRDTFYQVRVKLKQTSVSLPIRTTGFARVRVEAASIWSRVSRVFFQSFRL